MSGPTLGIRANLMQFSLLVLVNGFVGTMVGLERTVLPLLAARELGVASASATLTFLVAFGIVKALSNLAAGRLSDRVGRKPLLVAGWVAALPVAPLIIWAPSWSWVVAANALLGVNQGLAWSATVIMKIDLAGPRRRGLAMGLNEVAGYGAVSLAALVTGALAARFGPRPVPFLIGIVVSLLGLVLSAVAVRETGGHAASETASAPPVRSGRGLGRSFTAVCQAGLVNNLNDGMAWGLLPIFLAGRGLPIGRIGLVAAAYPASWTLLQAPAGAWSDRVGRKPMIVAGLWLQAAGIWWMAVGSSLTGWLAAAVVMGAGTALVYPTLLASVGDIAHPSRRATAVGTYRLWRDLGYAAGALLSGVVADLFGLGWAIGVVGLLTAASGFVVLNWMRETAPALRTREPGPALEDAGVTWPG